MENFGIICGMLFWGPVILAWIAYVRSGRPSRRVRYLGNGFFIAFVLLILGGCSRGILEGSLISASFGGDTAAAERLVRMGVDIDCEDENWHYTPVMCAAANGHIATVKALLRYHPDLKRKGHGITATGVAIANDHPDIARILEEAAASR